MYRFGTFNLANFSSNFTKGKECIGFINKQDTENGIDIGINDIKTGALISVILCDHENLKKFVDAIPALFSNIKAMIVNVFEIEEATEFADNLEFCQAIKSKLNSIKVPSYFLSKDDILLGCMIFGAKLNLKFGETIFTLLVYEKEVCIQELEFDKNGYKIIDVRTLDISINDAPNIIHQQITGSNEIKKIVLCLRARDNNASLMNFLKNHVFKADNPLIFGNDIDLKYGNYAVTEMAKWLLDKNYTKFYIHPICGRECLIRKDKEDDPILKIQLDVSLPISKSVIIDDPTLNYVFSYRNLGETKFFDRKIKFDKIFGTHEINVSMDIENFPICHVEPVIPEFVLRLPKTVAVTASKNPVIGFWDNFSVICIYKNGGYQFLDSWNGTTGKELLISFDEEEPKFFEAAYEAFKTKPSFVVYDILKIMLMPSDDIKIDKKWKFTFTSDDENPILLEFDNFDGKKSAASPTFLMAMILRQHFKAIEAEIGEKPKSVAVYYLKSFDNFDNLKASLNIGEEFQKVFKLLEKKHISCSITNIVVL